MNNLGGFSESLLEQGKSFAKKAGDTAAQGVKLTAQTAAAQVTGNFGLITDAGGTQTAHAEPTPAVPQHDQEEFIRELYGAEHHQQTQPNQVVVPPPTPPQVSSAEQHQLAMTRHLLSSLVKEQHMESYFNPTFNRPAQAEESVAEKNEREDQEKKFEEFEKQQKKPDFALQRAMTKTEGSPGASG